MPTIQDPEIIKPTEISELESRLTNLKTQLEISTQLEKAKQQESKPLETILKWEAPNRIFSEKGRRWYVIVSFLFMLGIVASALTKELLLIIVIIALMMLVYLANSIKPTLVVHEITNKGIRSGNDLWLWKNINGFWIAKRDQHLIVFLNLIDLTTHNRIMLLLGTEKPAEVVKILIRHISYLPRKDIGEDLINIFTLGEYQSLSKYLEDNSK